ncbi:MAG: ABC transporter substrate-binding protein [Burkholderiaceae bacterium]|nr:MAG: ABC transporter substrate-binding protein [Burkholderiaceae bacterium]MBE7427396.1 ABC transporter substrate-binding protein [Ideonella sp.]MCC7284849.1 ABC transporter substrate-binding protein [Burkholderiaceae bacterium]
MLAAVAAPALAQGAEGDIVVGQVGPFTVLPVPDAPQLNQGMKACLAQVNERGGINGRRVSFFEIDDTYSAEGFVKAFGQALQRRPAALLSPIGSSALSHALNDKLFDQADVIVINAIPGAEALRNPGHPKLFHIRAGDRQQIEKIVAHAATLGIPSLAVVHQDIVIGTSGLKMAQAAAQSHRIEVTGFQATTDKASLAAAAKKASDSGAKAVLVIGSPRFMADGVAELRHAGAGSFVFALSYVPAGLLAKIAGSGARGVALAQTFPNPMGVSLPLQREFQSGMKAAFPEVKQYTSFHLEGYISARVFAEAARRAKEVTPDGVARSLRAMGEYDMGGFRVNFARNNVGSSFVDIGVVTAEGRLMY